jgi:putative lipoprotein
MNRNATVLFYLTAFSMMAGCSAPALTKPEPADMSHVTVSADYRMRMMLPPDAELTATLEDVSLADAPARRLGETRIKTVSAPPYTLRISYDPTAIEARHTYAVRVQIRHQGRLLMTSNTHTPVLTQGHGNSAQLLLIAVPSSQP